MVSESKFNPMPIKEMREHEWEISWSGGKDSTASIILCHLYGVPIKKIVYVRMMFDENTPATLPIMTDFVDKAAETFRGAWGYDVEIIKSINTAVDIANMKYKQSKYADRIGQTYGVSAFCRQMCVFQQVKEKTVRQARDAGAYEIIGYAANEQKRIHRLGGHKQSIMVTLGIDERDALRICQDHNMLSPLYNTGISRDGCFFCPNAGKRERQLLRAEHLELAERIYDLIEQTHFDIKPIEHRNNWLRDWFEEKRERESGYKQLTIFDYGGGNGQAQM